MQEQLRCLQRVLGQVFYLFAHASPHILTSDPEIKRLALIPDFKKYEGSKGSFFGLCKKLEVHLMFCDFQWKTSWLCRDKHSVWLQSFRSPADYLWESSPRSYWQGKFLYHWSICMLCACGDFIALWQHKQMTKASHNALYYTGCFIC